MMISNQSKERSQEEQVITRFLSVIAHELRRPVGSLTSGIRLLQNSGADSTVTDILARETKRLELLIRQLFDAVQVSRDQFSLNRTPASLSCIVDLVLKEAGEATRQSVSVDGPIPEIELNVDLARVKQAVFNVILFAADHSRPDSEINIRAEKRPSGISLIVSSKGARVPQDRLPHLFDFFHTLEPFNGTQDAGLMLPTARRILEKHGGQLLFWQDEVSDQFKFELVLPVCAESL